jgi:hypothetical protein
MRKSYREYVNDLLPVADTLVAEPGLSGLPHFTTIWRFMLRVWSLLERVWEGSSSDEGQEAGLRHRLLWVLDASHVLLLRAEGQEGQCSLQHEEADFREMTRSRTRRLLKLTMGAELRHQLVTSVKVRRGLCNDTIDVPPAVRKAHSVRPIRVGISDKDYDSERKPSSPEGGAARHVGDPFAHGGCASLED